MSSAASLEAPKPSHQTTVGEEIAHAITHGLGAVLALAGFLGLLAAMPSEATPSQRLACVIYGGSLVVLYTASTMFHSVPLHWTRMKRLFQRVDHAAIYLLIAGTYTPYTLLALADPWGSRLFVVIWAIATFGLMLTLRSLWGHDNPQAQKRYERRALVLYLAMGWLGVLAMKLIVDALPGLSLGLLVAGGVAYTVGVAFFVLERKWMHSVWHGFVLAGSALHFASIVLIV
jgi:hemolysin III